MDERRAIGSPAGEPRRPGPRGGGKGSAQGLPGFAASWCGVGVEIGYRGDSECRPAYPAEQSIKRAELERVRKDQ